MNVAETLAEIRGRVEARLSRTVPDIPEIALPPLEPLRQARTVAEGWAGQMGVVNPRPPGVVNGVLQAWKKLLGRSLRWFAFPQTQFNTGVIASLVRTEDMFADLNRNIVVLGQNLADRQRAEEGSRMVLEIFRHQIDAQDQRLRSLEAGVAEISLSVGRAFDEQSRSLSRSLEEASAATSRALDAASQATNRALEEMGRALETMGRSMEVSLQEMRESQNRSLGEVRAGVVEAQATVAKVEERFWKDFHAYREEITEELRVTRRRLQTATAPAASAAPALSRTLPEFDYTRFEERFRGKQADIRQRQRVYLPMLEAPVLDVACGRGEMLELLREQGIAASGVDLDPDMAAICLEKGLRVERGDAFTHLEALPNAALGSVFSAQFVEHLPVEGYSRLIELAHAKLRPGGRLILETQNPECLAIFSQSFFLDPTHVRPVPAAQLRFLMEEAGFTGIEVHYLSPVETKLPGTGPETERFNATYFGAMDYGITGSKPK